MIDLFTLALTHGLIVLALWRLLFRPELDVEELPKVPRPRVGGDPVTPGAALAAPGAPPSPGREEDLQGQGDA